MATVHADISCATTLAMSPEQTADIACLLLYLGTHGQQKSEVK